MSVRLPDDVPFERSRRNARLRSRADAMVERARDRLAATRERVAAVDTGVQVYERDKLAAGTLLGSALVLRLFLFFVPTVLFALGVAGLVGHHAGIDSVPGAVGLSESLADEVNYAFAQGAITPWLAVATGLFGMALAGRSLTRALVLSSALSWRLGGKQSTPIRVVGIVVGLIVSIAIVAVILDRIRDAAGVAVAGLSFLVVAVVYAALWSLLFLALPRGTTDPGAALPGALVVALALTAMQAVTQLYFPEKVENASTLYGTFGVAVAVLGWFFILGRVLAFSFALNAVLYERLGSVSRLLFGLPGLRAIPARVPAVARFFDLDRAAKP